MTYTYTKIPNTREARRPPPGKYRLMWTGRTTEPLGLHHLQDFDRAQLAIDAAEALGFKGGNGIVETHEGWILTLNDGGAQMYTREGLLKSFGGPVRKHSKRSLTEEDVDRIEARQPNRLPGWQPGDKLLVFWQDIEEATGAKPIIGYSMHATP